MTAGVTSEGRIVRTCLAVTALTTLTSLSSLFGEARGTAGTWSRIAVVSIPPAWVPGGAVQTMALPFIWMARLRGTVSDAGGRYEVVEHT